MSHQANTKISESWKEAQDERGNIFYDLLKESLVISRAKRARAEGIRKIGLVCWKMGFINIVQYLRLCERNEIKPLWRLV